MNKKTKGIIAGAAGVALLAGGATFATWSDELSLGGGSITAGNLDVAPLTASGWYDASADRSDAVAIPGFLGTELGLTGHSIDAGTWRMVPGDKAVAAFPFQLALEGDNVVAELDVTGVTALTTANVPVSIALYDAAGDPVTVTAGKVRVKATDSGTGITGLTVDRTTIDGSDTDADMTAVVTVDFANVTDQTLVESELVDLTDVGVTLTQVRSGAGF